MLTDIQMQRWVMYLLHGVLDLLQSRTVMVTALWTMIKAHIQKTSIMLLDGKGQAASELFFSCFVLFCFVSLLQTFAS